MKKYHMVALMLVLLFNQAGKGEWQKRVDSLQMLLNTGLPDSSKAEIHEDIIDELLVNDPDNTLSHFQELKKIAINNSDTSLLLKYYIKKNEYYAIINDYQAALEHINIAIEISANNKAWLKECYFELAEISYYRDELDDFIYYARKSLEINMELNNQKDIIDDLLNVGKWHLESQNYDSAIYYFHDSRNKLISLDEEVPALLYSNIGLAFTYLNELDSALHYLTISLNMFISADSDYNIAIDEHYMGKVYFRKKEYNTAIKYLESSLKKSSKLKLFDICLHNHELLSKCYKMKNDYKTALHYSQLRNNCADSLQKRNREVIIQNLNSKFKYAEQQKEIQSQHAENVLLKKKETLLASLSIVSFLFIISLLFIIYQSYKRHIARKKILSELEQANLSKEKLISVVSHDLRSSVGNLRNATRVLTNYSVDAETTQELLECYFPIIDSTYDLLENLLTWVKFNKENLEPQIEQLDIKFIIKKSISHTRHLADSKSIEIISNLDNIAVSADRNMISTVARNLLSNAIKFSHADSKVVISTQITNDKVIVTVKDEGVGIKPAIMKKIFIDPVNHHSAGTRGERGSGLGLSICKSFLEKQGGHIWAKPNQDKGTSFYFSIPVSQNNLHM